MRARRGERDGTGERARRGAEFAGYVARPFSSYIFMRGLRRKQVKVPRRAARATWRGAHDTRPAAAPQNRFCRRRRRSFSPTTSPPTGYENSARGAIRFGRAAKVEIFETVNPAPNTSDLTPTIRLGTSYAPTHTSVHVLNASSVLFGGTPGRRGWIRANGTVAPGR